MLFYHGRGERDYGAQPLPCRRRAHWEFAAILGGRAAPLLDQPAVLDDRPALWIFPPRHPHGWQGASCRVCILHLAACPRLIATAVETAGYLRIDLTAAERKRIARLDVDLAVILASHPQAAELAADLARGTLGSIALDHVPTGVAAGDHDGERTVKQVLAWLDEHLHTGVGVADAGRAIGVSPAHLRRLCHQTSGRSPRDLLDELRLDRARDLLRRSQQPLEQVAWDCGYNSAVALSQAFMRRYGIRPGAWRRTDAG